MGVILEKIKRRLRIKRFSKRALIVQLNGFWMWAWAAIYSLAHVNISK